MAHVIDEPTTKQPQYPGQPTPGETQEPVHHHRVTDVDDSDEKAFFSWPPSTGMIIVVVFLVVLGTLAVFAGKSLFGTGPATSAQIAASKSSADLSQPSAATLTPAEQKEITDRDAYTVTIANELHTKVPAYKNVKIFADNWAGAKSPTKTPQTDPKTRVGDNLMLVFSSPEAGTAKGLADFAKSKAAQEAANAGFAELQFVGPDRYCYALIAPVSGVGDVKCGPR